MLAYYVKWHLREAWTPFLFEDEHPGRHEHNAPLSPAVRSPDAFEKARAKRTPAGATVHSFGTWIARLSTVARNTARMPAHPEGSPFQLVTTRIPCKKNSSGWSEWRLPQSVDKETSDEIPAFPAAQRFRCYECQKLRSNGHSAVATGAPQRMQLHGSCKCQARNVTTEREKPWASRTVHSGTGEQSAYAPPQAQKRRLLVGPSAGRSAEYRPMLRAWCST